MAEGEVNCGTGCLPAGYGCCPNDPNYGCLLERYCCSDPDGTPACCIANSDTSSSLNTATRQSSASLTSPTSRAALTSTESSNLGAGSTIITSTKRTPNNAILIVISSPSSSISRSSSTRVYVVRVVRGSHSFIFQSAMPFIVIYYLLLIGVFA